MTGLLPLARKFGEMLEANSVVEPTEPIEQHVLYPSRRDVWPRDEWEKMQRIRNGEEG